MHQELRKVQELKDLLGMPTAGLIEVWATAQGTLHEAILISLMTDEELDAVQLRLKVEGVLAQLRKMSQEKGIVLTERMHKSIVKRATDIISTSAV